jgi:transposase
MDLSWIHRVDATWDLIFGLLGSKNVHFVWLPKYSPEFNLVELYWRYLKEKIKNLSNADDFVHLQDQIIDITAQIPFTDFFLGNGSH